jgi:hypothetical protein
VANAERLVRVAQHATLRGICFDPEPYDFSLWEYAKQPRAKETAFGDCRAKVRECGAGLMRAFEAARRGPVVLTFFHVSLFDRFATLSEAEQAERLAKGSWGLGGSHRSAPLSH